MSDAGVPLGDPEMRAWMAFLAAGHLMDHEVERQLKHDGGLSHPEFEVLIRLERAEGGRLRMSDLARQVMISKSRLTYQVTRLERAGLVRRTGCETDRRSVWAELTGEGTAALERVRPGHRRVVRESLIDVLSPEEIALLGNALGRVADRLRTR
ncbi:MarR family winged helix-turn-helix transcriptional regulator [Actinomadura algeriensis]|uniref:DNA-binding MarR family transcriptional regulator n=1 Tax=Actinomadura algeriensis TaxID=1679523 RepID=A0ABR9JXZ6_9ACTN|nr:MarR family transcriptional regulator [Actinomadura algeriensis]MBE1535450.1 DNA-binding MarR family transcriptional regulator [Actinomadura algeriensis]